MGAGPEPRGLGGNRDTVGQCRDGWAKLSTKLVRGAVALAGISMPEAGAQQQRAAHSSTIQASPKGTCPGLIGARQKRRGDLARARQAVAAERDREPAAQTKPQKNTTGTSHRSLLPTPEATLRLPAHPKAQSQVTRCHELESGKVSGGLQRAAFSRGENT